MRRTSGGLAQAACSPGPAMLRQRNTAAMTPGTPALPRSWISRLLRRKQPTTYQRCLAVHIHFAGPHSALY